MNVSNKKHSSIVLSTTKTAPKTFVSSSSSSSSYSSSSSTIPKKVFIIPYRNRVNNLNEFLFRMSTILLVDETEPYEFYFAHQCDSRPFNRGAMKNIGFLAVKRKYPNDYKNITFIFHDVDTYPAKKGLIDYTTTLGVVKHYYGFKYALGGIFAIKGADFEKSKGFPNFWGWGLEDNLIQTRCLAAGLVIDRSIFYPITDTINILRPFDGWTKLVSHRDGAVYKWEQPDSMNDIKNLNYNIIMLPKMKNVFKIDITTFTVMLDPNDTEYISYDIRKHQNKIPLKSNYKRRNWSIRSLLKNNKQ